MSAERLLAVFAHPDDESLAAGGTLAACADRGVEVAVVCLTRGEAGVIAGPEIATREPLASVRERELRAACDALGVAAVECLGYRDGWLSAHDHATVRNEIKDAVRRWRPATIVTFGRDGFYDHPDHIAVYAYVTGALDALREDGIRPAVYYATWPRGLMAELLASVAARGCDVDLWGIDPKGFGVAVEPITTVVDVRAYLRRKLTAISSHRSQLPDGHLFRALDAELSETYLGYEYFHRARPANGEPDWLADVVASAAGARA